MKSSHGGLIQSTSTLKGEPHENLVDSFVGRVGFGWYFPDQSGLPAEPRRGGRRTPRTGRCGRAGHVGVHEGVEVGDGASWHDSWSHRPDLQNSRELPGEV